MEQRWVRRDWTEPTRVYGYWKPENHIRWPRHGKICPFQYNVSADRILNVTTTPIQRDLVDAQEAVKPFCATLPICLRDT